jgi:hypothetical protein
VSPLGQLISVLVGIYHICPVSPPQEYYVDISSESSGSTDFGESSLEHICPVSPPREHYVDIS